MALCLWPCRLAIQVITKASRQLGKTCNDVVWRRSEGVGALYKYEHIGLDNGDGEGGAGFSVETSDSSKGGLPDA